MEEQVTTQPTCGVSQAAFSIGNFPAHRYTGWGNAGAIADEIRQRRPRPSFTNMLIYAFPLQHRRERENLIPVLSRCVSFAQAIKSTGCVTLPHLMDAAGCKVTQFHEMVATNHEADADSGISSHLHRALLRAAWWPTHVDVKDGNREVSVWRVLRGTNTNTEFDGFPAQPCTHHF